MQFVKVEKNLYSPSLKDVAWLKGTQLIIVLILYTLVCKFAWVDAVQSILG